MYMVRALHEEWMTKIHAIRKQCVESVLFMSQMMNWMTKQVGGHGVKYCRTHAERI
jgi:hypothetical protein